jgi:predicted permease
MATTLQAQWNAVYGATPAVAQQDQTPIFFQQRVAMAMMQVAITVMTEANTTTNHASRLSLAQKILWNPTQWMAAIAQAMASQGFDNTSTDAAIINELSAGWNALAGVP